MGDLGWRVLLVEPPLAFFFPIICSIFVNIHAVMLRSRGLDVGGADLLFRGVGVRVLVGHWGLRG